MLLRDIGLPFALFALFALLPNDWILMTFVIVAWGHINLAMLYQYRAGKITSRYALVAAASIALGVGYFLWVGYEFPIYVLGIAAFALHFSVDEFYLHGETLTWKNGIIAGIVTALFTSISLLPSSPVYQTVIMLLVGFGLAVLALRSVVARIPPSRTEVYLCYVGALLMVFKFGTHFYTAFGVLSLLHFVNWYIAYGMKVSGTARALRYWSEVALCTVMGATLFFLYFIDAISFLKYLFGPLYYTAWSILHFILSSRWVSGLKRPLFG